MKPKLLIVTGSKFKFGDLAEKLGEFFDCEQKTLNEPEIQGEPGLGNCPRAGGDY